MKKHVASALESELKMLADSSQLNIPPQHWFPGVSPTEGPMAFLQGGLEFTVQSQGHKKAVPVSSTPFHNTCTQANAVMTFFESESFISLVRSISKLLYVVDKENWVLCHQRQTVTSGGSGF